MRDVNWLWAGSPEQDARNGIATFVVGTEELVVEFSNFKEADSIFKLLKEAYLLGKETGVHSTCEAVRKAMG